MSSTVKYGSMKKKKNHALKVILHALKYQAEMGAPYIPKYYKATILAHIKRW